MEDKVDYIAKFKAAMEKVGDKVQIQGDIIFVERLSKIGGEERTTKGGIIIAAPPAKQKSWAADQPEFVKVLALGQGYVGEDGEEIDIDLKVGDVVQIGQNSVKWYTVFGNDVSGNIGVMREGEKWVKFDGVEAYQMFMEEFQ